MAVTPPRSNRTFFLSSSRACEISSRILTSPVPMVILPPSSIMRVSPISRMLLFSLVILIRLIFPVHFIAGLGCHPVNSGRHQDSLNDTPCACQKSTQRSTFVYSNLYQKASTGAQSCAAHATAKDAALWVAG